MELMGISIESDKTWMKLADMMVDTGVITDCLECQQSREKTKVRNE
jgi:hypothetical protein